MSDGNGGDQIGEKVGMTDVDRLNLQKMIKEQNVEDQTAHIRSLKHSNLIAADILTIRKIQRDNPGASEDTIRELCVEACPFLYKNYLDIFNRMYRGALDTNMFSRFLFVLKRIEDGELNAHEGAYSIGKLLKEIYVDSAMRKADIQNAANGIEEKEHEFVKPRDVTWRQYKTRDFMQR